jgi:hypothetical protein
LLALLVLGLTAAVLTAQRRRQHLLVGRVITPRLAEPHTGASILYFTGESCTICHTAQAPALAALHAELGDAVTVRTVDVAREPGLARRYRVMSLPTTIVLDARGRVTAVNAGFASTGRLRDQVAAARPLVTAAA